MSSDAELPDVQPVNAEPACHTKNLRSDSERVKRDYLSNKLVMMQHEERALQTIIVQLRHQHSKLAHEKTRIVKESLKYVKEDELNNYDVEDEGSTSDDESGAHDAPNDRNLAPANIGTSNDGTWMETVRQDPSNFDLRGDHNNSTAWTHVDEMDLKLL